MSGRDYELTGSEEGKEILITASDSLEDRFDPKVCRSIPCTFKFWEVADLSGGSYQIMGCDDQGG